MSSVEVDVSPSRATAVGSACASAIIPGLGQAMQRRFGAAALQFGTVAAYLAAAGGLEGRRALVFALFWNLWSVIDAYRHGAE